MNAPKSLLNVMHDIKSELKDFCSSDWSKKLILLIKEKGCWFSVKSRDKTYLWIAYEDAFIALHWEQKPEISFSTSGDDKTSESERFKQDESVFKRLLRDLKRLKSYE